jgi:DNA-binding MarR family transcriptional regulator
VSVRRLAPAPFDLASFLPHKLSVLSRLTQGLLAAALDKSGLTIAQWRVYLCLARQGPSHLNGIAAFTFLPQSSLSRSIAQMADRGLVRNARKADDRRISRIELTPAGHAYFEQVTGAIDDACKKAFRMEADEEAGFISTIDELIARLSSQLAHVPGAAVDPIEPARSGPAASPPAPSVARSKRRGNASRPSASPH